MSQGKFEARCADQLRRVKASFCPRVDLLQAPGQNFSWKGGGCGA